MNKLNKLTINRSNKIIDQLFKFYKNVKPGLNYDNIYQLTISVVLSAQTTDKQVNSVTGLLFKKYPDFESLSKAKVKDVEKIIHSTGFYKNKSSNIIKIAKKIISDFNNKVPDKLDDLEKLPGVGRKSANVILSIGYNIPAFAVDTHIIRISNRLGYINSKNPLKVEKALTALIPKSKWNKAHLVLINHGREICKARNPICQKCPIYDLCFSNDKTVGTE